MHIDFAQLNGFGKCTSVLGTSANTSAKRNFRNLRRYNSFAFVELALKFAVCVCGSIFPTSANANIEYLVLLESP